MKSERELFQLIPGGQLEKKTCKEYIATKMLNASDDTLGLNGLKNYIKSQSQSWTLDCPIYRSTNSKKTQYL